MARLMLVLMSALVALPFVATVQAAPPTLAEMPGEVTLEATGPDGVAVSYLLPGASDDTDPAPQVTCWPASGSMFPLGTTSVRCQATDAEGEVSQIGAFNVTVVDTRAPSLTVPTLLRVHATSASGTPVTFDVFAADTVDPTPSVTCTPASGSAFLDGLTSVTCAAQDDSGNTATATFEVLVCGLACQVEELRAAAASLDNVFQRRIESVRQAVESGDVADACRDLAHFERQVRNASAKKMSPELAQDLLERTDRIQAVYC